ARSGLLVERERDVVDALAVVDLLGKATRILAGGLRPVRVGEDRVDRGQGGPDRRQRVVQVTVVSGTAGIDFLRLTDVPTADVESQRHQLGLGLHAFLALRTVAVVVHAAVVVQDRAQLGDRRDAGERRRQLTDALRIRGGELVTVIRMALAVLAELLVVPGALRLGLRAARRAAGADAAGADVVGRSRVTVIARGA